MSIEEIESITDLLFGNGYDMLKTINELNNKVIEKENDIELLNQEIEKLNKCLDEIDLIIYRLRFIEFIDDKALIETLNNLLNEIRLISQLKDIEKYNKLKKEVINNE